jgi:putative membrane protein insertion efficiency factor
MSETPRPVSANPPVSAERARTGPIAWLLIACVSAYQVLLRPLLVGGGCPFHPHCSQYAIDALRRHGAIRGGRLALLRILRCRPGAVGGYDPVPD